MEGGARAKERELQCRVPLCTSPPRPPCPQQPPAPDHAAPPALPQHNHQHQATSSPHTHYLRPAGGALFQVEAPFLRADLKAGRQRAQQLPAGRGVDGVQAGHQLRGIRARGTGGGAEGLLKGCRGLPDSKQAL